MMRRFAVDTPSSTLYFIVMISEKDITTTWARERKTLNLFFRGATLSGK